jgi:hypothetical protein
MNLVNEWKSNETGCGTRAITASREQFLRVRRFSAPGSIFIFLLVVVLVSPALLPLSLSLSLPLSFPSASRRLLLLSFLSELSPRRRSFSLSVSLSAECERGCPICECFGQSFRTEKLFSVEGCYVVSANLPFKNRKSCDMPASNY